MQALLLAAFLNMSNRIEGRETQAALQLAEFDVPPPPDPVHHFARHTESKVAGGSAASSAEAAVAASSKVAHGIPEATKVAVLPTPLAPANPSKEQSSSGTVPVSGELAIANGNGSGTGSGNGNGAGAGNGNDGPSVVEPPRLVTSVLTNRDFPSGIIENWPRAATVFLRLRINARGYVSECLLDRGTNVRAIDAQMCNTAHERLRFRPAFDQTGKAVAGWVGYAQPAPR